MITPASFQKEICDAMVAELSSADPAACVLIAPTASGKTLMTGTVVANVSDLVSNVSGEMGVAWFWFAPFDTIVEQTGHTLMTDVADQLTLRSLAEGRTYGGHASGDIWISTTALATNPTSKLREDTERSPSLATLVSRIRIHGLKIGLVIDEAHIAADNETRFGEVCRDLAPDLFIAVTATPKDGRLERLISSLGIHKRRDFSVPHEEVVRARLNKSSLRATRMLAARDRKDLNDDLIQDKLIEVAWAYQTDIETTLQRLELPVSPLLLVQIGNGDDEAGIMRTRLKSITSLKDHEIATYLDSTRTHGSLTSVAANPSVRALISKLAAGTGFDAPRAWVLASTRNVEDQDHALQFIGRIMRVQRDVRSVFIQDLISLEDAAVLDKAHLVVMDDASQTGFKSAADLVRRIQKEFDPEVQTIEIHDVEFKYENREQSVPDRRDIELHGAPDDKYVEAHELTSLRDQDVFGEERRIQGGIFDASQTITPATDALERGGAPSLRTRPAFGPLRTTYTDFHALERDVENQGLAIYALRRDLPGRPAAFIRERWPDFSGTVGIAHRLAAAVPITSDMVRQSCDQAMGNFTIHPMDVALLGRRDQVIESRITVREPELASRKAIMDFNKAITRLPSLADSRVQGRFLDHLVSEIDRFGGRSFGLNDESMETMARLFVVQRLNDYQSAESREFSQKARLEDAFPLPDFIVSPRGCLPSARNIYSFIPPVVGEDYSTAILGWKEKSLELEGRSIFVDTVNHGWLLNDTEARLVDVLQSHKDVLWWARNPVRKPYSISILKIDGKRGFFYPDFVVGTAWGDRIGPQLIETKYDEHDMRQKLARGRTESYGRVIFIALRDGQLKIVDKDGKPVDQVTPEITGPLTNAFRDSLAP